MTSPQIKNNTLIISFSVSRKYFWWIGSQKVVETLTKLGREDLIPEYKTDQIRINW